jgi:predicted O-methyltransferase YrrM
MRQRVAKFVSVAGFNTLSKMYYLFDTIKENNSKVCVEIGVYGGRTLLPMSLACTETGGTVIGIDPWNVADAAQPEIAFRTDNIDFNKLYCDLIFLLDRERLTNVRLVRATSQAAVNTFADGSIDFLHIDGNHSREKVLQDAAGYLPKVKPGGIIVLDDVSMPTISDALAFLSQRCELMQTDILAGRDDKTFRRPKT